MTNSERWFEIEVFSKTSNLRTKFDSRVGTGKIKVL